MLLVINKWKQSHVIIINKCDYYSHKKCDFDWKKLQVDYAIFEDFHHKNAIFFW